MMTESLCIAAISPLRQRLLDDMAVRRFSWETQRNCLRDVGRFATFLGRSPHTATVEDVRQFQIEQNAAGTFRRRSAGLPGATCPFGRPSCLPAVSGPCAQQALGRLRQAGPKAVLA
ncbi:hypothetical protein ASY01nite_24110 [Acetobacter syzygii]|nr:phage DNA recombinase XerD [Acetobacter syzygii]GEL57345.1 hypothetical protein ASY01nite_24110 [Acetobacter syzygii]